MHNCIKFIKKTFIKQVFIFYVKLLYVKDLDIILKIFLLVLSICSNFVML